MKSAHSKALNSVAGINKGGRATYLGMKRTRLHEEKQPTSFAKSVRRHEEK